MYLPIFKWSHYPLETKSEADEIYGDLFKTK